MARWSTKTHSRAGRLLAIAVALAAATAACGDDDDTTAESETSAAVTTAGTTAGAPDTSSADTSSASTAPASSAPASSDAATPDDMDPDGVLRIPFDLAGAQANFDPVGVTAPFWWHYAVYDTLLRMNDDGSYEPGLAKEATIVDPSTITVELNEGLTFQDGTPLDADAVKQTIERNKASEKPGIFRLAELSQVASIDVESPTTLRINLATPIAGSFYNLLSQGETMPVSPTAIANGVDLKSNPVGAGPFMVETFNPPDTVKLVKWDDYFEADKIRLAGVEFVNVTATDPTALINALRTHAVDGVGGQALSLDAVGQLGGDVTTETRKSQNGTLFVSMQCDTFPAFQDVRVRQALNYATDKEALNQVVLQGKGEPMSQFWSSDAEWYDPALADVYAYDPDRARELLAEAGFPELEFKMAITPGFSQRVAEVLQEQWSQVGVTVTLHPIQDAVTEYYIGKQQDTFPTLQNRIWTDKITRNFAPGSTGNTCDPKSEDFNQRLAALRAVDPASPDAVDAWSDVSTYLNENAQGIFLLINVLNFAWDENRVGDVSWAAEQVGVRWLDWHKVYIKN